MKKTSINLGFNKFNPKRKVPEDKDISIGDVWLTYKRDIVFISNCYIKILSNTNRKCGKGWSIYNCRILINNSIYNPIFSNYKSDSEVTINKYYFKRKIVGDELAMVLLSI